MEKTELNNDNTMKVFELGYLLVPTIAEEKLAAEADAIKSLVESRKGQFITEDFPKLRQLAYTMVKAIGGGERLKHDKAYFGWIKFEVEASAVPHIKMDLDKNKNILRYMITNTVRENTMVTQKMIFKPGDVPGKKEDGEEKVPVSEEELDKTIDNLVVE